ncbi:hypothetical protein [Gilliamella sp. ESL0250]|nr:hypothetical protein [Gilliamella sp. ESL0250]
MVYYKSANIDDGEYWPQWMVEAFNATSQAKLAEIKQRYHVK